MSGITRDEINACIRLVSGSLKAFMRSEHRTQLRSALFDVPRRSSLGWECLYLTAYPLLVELTSGVAPEDMGRRMRRLCSRPNGLTLSILICCYLAGRQQRLLDLGVGPEEPFPEDDLERLGFVVDFWRRVSRAYRTDGKLLPEEGGGTQPILDEEGIARLRSLLQEVDPSEQRRVRRLAATLELYAFLLHGEQRDGLFAHGPYEGDSGDVIVVREFTDLRNTYLPWARTRTSNLYSNIAWVLALRDVRVRFDLFGGMHIDPPEYGDRVRASALVTVSERGEVRPIPSEEIEEIQRRAAEAYGELYREALGWSPRFKIEYGLYLFANHMKTFFDVAGLEAGERILRVFEEAAAPFLVRLLAGELPSIWRFWETTEGDFFYPVVSEH